MGAIEQLGAQVVAAVEALGRSLSPSSRKSTSSSRKTERRRAVGYCENPGCAEYLKGVFLFHRSKDEYKKFCCTHCRKKGFVEFETGGYTGNPDRFKEVRVEFNFSPGSKKYLLIAIVRDENLWGRTGVYTLHSPLIRTEKRALKTAEAILGNLNRRGIADTGGVEGTGEVVISLDDSREEFMHRLDILAEELKKSNLV
jgi:hypothetical protein